MATERGIVSFYKAPSITALTQPALIKFETAYAKYVRQVNDSNADRAADDQLTVASIRDCMDSSLLQSLCILKKIEGATTVEDATDDKVKSWFDNAITATPRSLPARLNAAMSTVKYELCDEDPSGAVLTFCAEAVKALDQNNASDITQDVDKAKVMIDMLQNKVEPPLLRKRIKDERNLWTKDQNGDISYFTDELIKLVAEVQQNEDARKSLIPRRNPYNSRKRNRDRDSEEDPTSNPEGSKDGKKSTLGFNIGAMRFPQKKNASA